MVIPHPRTDTYALLTRPPLPLLAVRLACVRHAASVRSEPGSNSQVHTELRIAPCGTTRLSHELDPTLYSVRTTKLPGREPNMFNAYLGGYARHARLSWSVARPTRRATQRPRLSARARHPSMPWAPPTYPFHSILCSSQRTKPAQRCSAPSATDGVLGRPPWGCQRLATQGSKKPVDREFSSVFLGFS